MRRSKLSRLSAPHLRLLLRAIVFFLLAWQRIEDANWLRPWLLPDRRKPARYHLVGCSRKREIRPGLVAAWLLGVAVLGFLFTSPNPRPWLLFCTFYGFIISVLILLRFLKWSLSHERT